ncbi:MAG: fumarylacetoacetate hydrolase family protein [Gammaproteobacteria bacterium]
MRLSRITFEQEVWIASANSAGDTMRLHFTAHANGDTMIELIADSDMLDIDKAAGKHVPASEVKFLPPIIQPSKNILCVGKNYRAHAHEFARSGFDNSQSGAGDEVPEFPIIFSKAPCTMVGAFAHIEPPWDITQKVDYEAELGVIIGRQGRNIKKSDAEDHVWGYTIINDVTARDLQAQHKQWLLGKSIDTFCPIGPWIVSKDEVAADNLDVTCLVNGEARQEANTGDLIFDIPTIIETISASMTLNPGDIIATGTPAGVGIGFDPPKFLAPGDTVEISISNIGTIKNRVI